MIDPVIYTTLPYLEKSLPYHVGHTEYTVWLLVSPVGTLYSSLVLYSCH